MNLVALSFDFGTSRNDEVPSFAGPSFLCRSCFVLRSFRCRSDVAPVQFSCRFCAGDGDIFRCRVVRFGNERERLGGLPSGAVRPCAALHSFQYRSHVISLSFRCRFVPRGATDFFAMERPKNENFFRCKLVSF